ncbi:usg protein [Thalassovita mediterranea]|nr:usg protein [Thalassovita mediterranea]
MADDDFRDRLKGGGLLTAEVLYYRPDYPSLLQSFVWQTVDIAPKFPRLAGFLDRWRREIDAVIHSVNIAHSDLLKPAEVRLVGDSLKLH